MPDDLFERLAHDDLDLHPLPAAEVRRRGDRLRRRRAGLTIGGSALAVALVAAPLAFLDRGGDDSAPDPAAPTTSTTAVGPAGPRTIPADFPLDLGTDGSASSGSGQSGPGVTGVRLRLCGQGGWPAGSTSRLAVTAVLEAGSDTRELRLYATEARAQSVVTELRDVAATCGTDQTGDGPYTVTGVDADTGDDSATWVYADASGRPVGDIVQVVRVGRALLATRDSSEWTAASGAAYVPQRTAITLPVVAAMCVWSADGCAASSPTSPRSPRSPTTGPSAAEDLSGVPIEQGLRPVTEGVPLDGPSATARGIDEGPCGDGTWPSTPASRWAVTATGPEYRDSRELRVFATADEAVAAVGAVRRSVASCAALGPQGGSGTVVRAVDATTGYDSVTWVLGYQQSLGGEIHQMVRVGRAVLATVSGGEYLLDTVEDSVPDRTVLSRRLAPTLCAYTAAGC